MSVELRNKIDKILKENDCHFEVFEGYGLTEGVSVNCVNTYVHNRVGSIGYPAPGAKFRIVDENNKEVPVGQIGEITIQSPGLMMGYFEDEAATKAAIIDGWLHTGDLGHVDEDGFVYFNQRLKRVVKVSGVGVFPTEIERLIEHIPGVKQACAIQIPDIKLIHAIKVFVVADYFDEQGMKDLIMEHCRKYLIRLAVPKEIEFIKELPLTLLGKIDFKTLQKEEDKRRGII